MSSANHPHRRHELSTGGGPPSPFGVARLTRISPWCVVRSPQPSSRTGPQPQRPHCRASGSSMLSSCRLSITCFTRLAAGSSALACTYSLKAASDTCNAMSRSLKGRAASQPWPCSGQKHSPPSSASRPSSFAIVAASAFAASRLDLASVPALETTYVSRQLSHVEWLAAHVILFGESS
eukprot:scaffold88602_cov64-Phaeocystis_antarctica.AAC.4